MPEEYDDRPEDLVHSLLVAGRPEVDTTALAQPSARLARQISATPPARGRRRRRGVAISVAALVAMVPTSAAAYVWSTHTGVFGQPDRYTEDVDTSEVLDLCAPDFPSTAWSLMPKDLRLPHGATLRQAFDAVERSMTRDCRDGDGIGAVTQATGVPAQAEGYAWCSWVNTYLAEPAERDDAASALKLYANSDITHVVDADGAMTRWENKVADAAARGDAGPVRYDQRVNCDGGDYGWRP